MISGIILAAGTSSRFGRPKQLLELDGKILVQHVVDAAAKSSLDEIVIVLGHDAEAVEAALELPERTRVVYNDEYAAGQSTSLRAGIASCSSDTEAAAILLGDQPGMSAALIDAILEKWRATKRPVVRAMFGDAPGHPVLISRKQWDLVDRATGDSGLRLVFAAFDDVFDVQLGEHPPADVDTWEDYERLKRERHQPPRL